MLVRSAATGHRGRPSVDERGGHHRYPRRYLAIPDESVKLVNPAARLMPIARSTDSGCRTILLREPPIRTLAPKPGPNATLALAPT